MKARTQGFKNAIGSIYEINDKITYTIDGIETELIEELNSVQPHYETQLLKSVMKCLDINSTVDIPKGTVLNYKFGVKVNNAYEYINYGNYVVYSSEKQEDNNDYLIKCYDKMLYSMVDYETPKVNNVAITYPITVREYISAICSHLGLQFKNANDIFTNYDKLIESELYLDSNGNSLDYKFRDVLDELSQVTASNIVINEEDDELEIRYITNADAEYTSVNGKELTLENVDDAKNFDLNLIGETTQETTTGKNKANSENLVTTTINDVAITPHYTNGMLDYINVNGTASSNVSYSMLNNNFLNNSNNYILSGCPSDGSVNTYRLTYYNYDTNGSYIFGDNDLGSGKNMVITQSNYAYTRLVINIKSGTNCNNLKFYPMIRLSSVTDDTYEPYTGGIASPNPDYPQDIHTISGDNEIKVVGKNLFDKTNTNYIYAYISANGTIGDTLQVKTYYIDCKPNTNYTISKTAGQYFRINTTSNIPIVNMTCLQQTVYNDTGSNLTILTNSNAKYLVFNIYNSSQDTITEQEMLNSVMIEKGNQATTYELYQEQVNEVNLGKNLFNFNDFQNNGTGRTTFTANDKSITINATSGGTYRFVYKRVSELHIGEAYTISIGSYTDTNTSHLAQWGIANTSGTFYGGVKTLSSVQTITFTPTENVADIRIGYLSNSCSTGDTLTINQVQLEKGTQATSYSPYFTPIELCKIGNYKDKIFKASGKNLYNASYRRPDNNTIEVSNGTATEENGLFTLTATDRDVYMWQVRNEGISYDATRGELYEFIDDNYTITVSNSEITTNYVTYFDENKVSLGYVNINASTFTISKNDKQGAKYFTLRFGKAASVAGNVYKFYVQLEKGNTSTNYEPHNANGWYLKKNISKIESYNGETITTQYISTTGGLDTGATIYYVAQSPTYIPLNNTLQEQLNSVRLLEGYNYVNSTIPLELNYVSNIDTIDEEYCDEDNVNFGELYGPINTVILSRSAESDELAKSVPSGLVDEEKIAIKISDNQLLNFDNREEYLDGILNKLNGLSYYTNDFTSKGIMYYNVCDRYKANIFGKSYYCIMLNDDVVNDEDGIEENIFTDMPSVAKTDYSKTSTTDKTVRKANLTVDKQLGEIRGEVENLETSINGDNGLATRMTRAESRLTDTEATLTFIEENTLNEDGSVKSVKTSTDFTFDNEGLKIGKSTDDYNSLQDNTGTYYFERDTMTGKYTKDGSVQKNLGLFGKYYYGVDENVNVATFSKSDAKFVAQLYTKNGQECFGHFWNSN